MSCNPCKTTLTNTPQCESLPSQIQNFSDQFFGAVVKTEVDGEVIWTLPCDLDEGLPNNPRAEGEGLACYLIRLLDTQIVGLTGPQGADGTAGANGINAFTVTLQAFAQPSPASPNVQLLTAYNPAMMEGAYIFVETSGWYQITATDTSGAVFATLFQALPGAPAVINAGKLVVLSGVPGATVVGPQGPAGPTGPAGSNATSFSVDNGEYFAPVGTDYQLGVTYAAVDFVNSSPVVLLPATGTYRVTAVADIVGLATVATSDVADLKLVNTSTVADVPGSEHSASFLSDTQRTQITIIVRVQTTAPNQTIALYGRADTANAIAVVALATNMTFERLA